MRIYVGHELACVMRCLTVADKLFTYLFMTCQLRRQLVGTFNADGSALGLFGRAIWHHDNPNSGVQWVGAAAVCAKERAAFESKSTVAWLKALKELDSSALPQRSLAVKLVRKCLVLLTGTNNVERWLHELSLQELKSRAGKLSSPYLEAAVRLNVQNFLGRRSFSRFAPDELLLDAEKSKLK